MENGSIVIVALPQADGREKNRPALVLCRMPPYNDLLLCGISSQIHQAVPDSDELLNESDADFPQTRLKKSSVIRTRYLATVPLSEVKGRMGRLPETRLHRVYASLATFFNRLQAGGEP